VPFILGQESTGKVQVCLKMKGNLDEWANAVAVDCPTNCQPFLKKIKINFAVS